MSLFTEKWVVAAHDQYLILKCIIDLSSSVRERENGYENTGGGRGGGLLD